MSGRNTDIDIWSAHWQFESATGRARRPELEQLLEPVWDEFTAVVRDGARILDLATGNGPVALRCAEMARALGKRLRIDAVDAAEISPPNQPMDPSGLVPPVDFRGGVWLENLPFEDGTFDGVMSQNGFEYADEERSIAEIARILAPGGQVRLLIHARSGAVWRDIQLRNSRMNEVLAEDGLLNLVLELARAQKSQDEDRFRQKAKLLPAAAEKANKLAEQPPNDDSALFYCREFHYVWTNRNQYRIDDLLRSLEDGWTHASGTAGRYAQMLDASRSAEDIARLCSRFKAAGLTTGAVRQVCDPVECAQIAWQVDARKPA